MIKNNWAILNPLWLLLSSPKTLMFLANAWLSQSFLIAALAGSTFPSIGFSEMSQSKTPKLTSERPTSKPLPTSLSHPLPSMFRSTLKILAISYLVKWEQLKSNSTMTLKAISLIIASLSGLELSTKLVKFLKLKLTWSRNYVKVTCITNLVNFSQESPQL